MNPQHAVVTRETIYTKVDDSLPQCSICCEDINSDTYKTIDGSPICGDCIAKTIVPKFEKALHHEIDYPVIWGGRLILSPDDFVEELGEGLFARFKQIEEEYKTPPNDRVYCKHLLYPEKKPLRGMQIIRSISDSASSLPVVPPARDMLTLEIEAETVLVECGAMVDSVRSLEDRRDSISLLKPCWSCEGYVCPQCGDAIFDSDELKAHNCKWKPGEDWSNFKGMTRGKDYQICPNPKCRAAVDLQTGCNHVKCPNASCGWGMCFLCGEGPLAHNDPEHWKSGKPCPCFNRLDQENRQYDEDVMIVEDD